MLKAHQHYAQEQRKTSTTTPQKALLISTTPSTSPDEPFFGDLEQQSPPPRIENVLSGDGGEIMLSDLTENATSLRVLAHQGLAHRDKDLPRGDRVGTSLSSMIKHRVKSGATTSTTPTRATQKVEDTDSSYSQSSFMYTVLTSIEHVCSASTAEQVQAAAAQCKPPAHNRVPEWCVAPAADSDDDTGDYATITLTRTRAWDDACNQEYNKGAECTKSSTSCAADKNSHKDAAVGKRISTGPAPVSTKQNQQSAAMALPGTLSLVDGVGDDAEEDDNDDEEEEDGAEKLSEMAREDFEIILDEQKLERPNTSGTTSPLRNDKKAGTVTENDWRGKISFRRNKTELSKILEEQPPLTFNTIVMTPFPNMKRAISDKYYTPPLSPRPQPMAPVHHRTHSLSAGKASAAASATTPPPRRVHPPDPIEVIDWDDASNEAALTGTAPAAQQNEYDAPRVAMMAIPLANKMRTTTSTAAMLHDEEDVFENVAEDEEEEEVVTARSHEVKFEGTRINKPKKRRSKRRVRPKIVGQVLLQKVQSLRTSVENMRVNHNNTTRSSIFPKHHNNAAAARPQKSSLTAVSSDPVIGADNICPAVACKSSWKLRRKRLGSHNSAGTEGNNALRQLSGGGPTAARFKTAAIDAEDPIAVSPPPEARKKEGQWEHALEANTGRTYYCHRLTRQTLWTKPAKVELYVQSERGKSHRAEVDKKIGAIRMDPEGLTAGGTGNGGAEMPEPNHIWNIKKQVSSLIGTIPDLQNIDRLMAQYDGRENELLGKLKDMKKDLPFDEPKSEGTAAINALRAGANHKAHNADDPPSVEPSLVAKSRTRTRTTASTVSSFPGRTEMTQAIRHARASKRVSPIQEWGQSYSSDEHGHGVQQKPSATARVRGVPKKKVQRQRELCVEDFSIDRVKACTYDASRSRAARNRLALEYSRARWAVPAVSSTPRRDVREPFVPGPDGGTVTGRLVYAKAYPVAGSLIFLAAASSSSSSSDHDNDDDEPALARAGGGASGPCLSVLHVEPDVLPVLSFVNVAPAMQHYKTLCALVDLHWRYYASHHVCRALLRGGLPVSVLDMENVKNQLRHRRQRAAAGGGAGPDRSNRWITYAPVSQLHALAPQLASYCNSTASTTAINAAANANTIPIRTGWDEIVAATFLAGYWEPVMVLLHSAPGERVWSGNVRRNANDCDDGVMAPATIYVTALSVAVRHQRTAILWSTSAVCGNATQVASLPSTLPWSFSSSDSNNDADLLAIAANSIARSESGQWQQIVTNGWAHTTCPTSLRLYLRFNPLLKLQHLDVPNVALYVLQRTVEAWTLLPTGQKLSTIGQVSILSALPSAAWLMQILIGKTNSHNSKLATTGWVVAASGLGDGQLLVFALENIRVPMATIAPTCGAENEQWRPIYTVRMDAETERKLHCEEEALYAPDTATASTTMTTPAAHGAHVDEGGFDQWGGNDFTEMDEPFNSRSVFQMALSGATKLDAVTISLLAGHMLSDGMPNYCQ